MVEAPVDASEIFLVGDEELHAITASGSIGFRPDELIHGSVEKSACPSLSRSLSHQEWANSAESFTLAFVGQEAAIPDPS